MSNRRQLKRQISTSSSLTHLGEQLAHTGKGLSMKLPYAKSRCWQSWLSGFPFLHTCSLFCYRWPVKSHQIPTTLIKINITPDWWGIVSWCFLFLMVLLTLLKTLYKENVFGDESEFLVALLKDEWVLRRVSSSPFTCHWVIPSYSVFPEVLHKWYGWPF